MSLVLKLMRDNLKHLTWILGLVVLAFVFSVFADYGGQGRWFGGASGSWAALVNGEEISIKEFLDQARSLDRYYRNLLGNSYDPARFNLNIGQQAINQLIQNRVILSHARSLGLTATPEEVRDQIIADPSLQGENGFIGASRYKDLLRSNGRDPGEYESGLARQVLLRKWIEVVTADIGATDRQVEEEIRRRDERADVVFARFRPRDFENQVQPSDEEITAYYEENLDAYRRGEGRSFEILVLDRLREQRDISVPEAGLRAEYEASLQTRFQVPEQRRASHILFKTPPDLTDSEIAGARSSAETVLARLQAGEDFAEVAKEVSEDPSAANGGDLGFFGRGVMTVPFEQAVWRLGEIGETADIVRTQFGFHIIKLTGKRDSRIKPFEEVREELAREMAFRLAGEQVRDRAQEFHALVKDRPDGFKDEAARQSRVVTETGAVYPGDPIPGLGPNPEVERALFGLAQGEISEPIAIPRGYLMARFIEPQAGGAPPLEEIKDRVEADLRGRRAQEMALQLAERALADPEGRELPDLGGALGFEVEEVSTVARGVSIGSLGSRPEIERVIFSAEVGKLNGPLEIDDETVLLQVRSRDELTEEEVSERVPPMRQQLMASRRQLAISVVTRELVKAADIRYNVDVIQGIDSPTTTASTN